MSLRTCALAFVLAFSAGAQESHNYRAKIMTDDGSPPPKTPLIMPDTNSNLSYQCASGSNSGGNKSAPAPTPTDTTKSVPSNASDVTKAIVANASAADTGTGSANERNFQYFKDGTVQYSVNLIASPDSSRTIATVDPTSVLFNDACPVVIRLSGYQTVHVILHDNAKIVLHRVGAPSNASVSMTDLKAPADAKKVYQRGAAALNEERLDFARRSLEKAVALYPEYARAWVDLSEADRRSNLPEEARRDAERAIKADSGFLPAYAQLAHVELDANQNRAAFDLTAKALAGHQGQSLALTFYHAVAALNLKDYPEAEKTAQICIALDTNREFPRAEYLLGLALAAQGHRDDAVQHLRTYLAVAPIAADSDEVRRLIVQLAAGPVAISAPQ